MKNALVISKISYLKVNSWMEIKKSDKGKKNAHENFGATLKGQYLTVGVQGVVLIQRKGKFTQKVHNRNVLKPRGNANAQLQKD